MAEEKPLNIETAGRDQGEKEDDKKNKGYKYLFLILRYVLFLVVLSIFVITITFLTVNFLQDQYRITNSASSLVLNTQQNVPEELAWFQQIGELRGNLRDTTLRKVFIADIFLGYPLDDQLTIQELTRKSVQIRERISLYFSSRYSVDLEGNTNFVRMKIEIKDLVNRILNNKIREVAFNSFQIVSF